MTVDQLQEALDELGAGVLLSGKHQAGERKVCALEFESQMRGRPWSDAPRTLPDVRPLNDAQWSSDAARTAALLPVMAALWRWADWTLHQRQQWTTQIILETVRKIVSALPGLPKDIQEQCHSVKELPAAAMAARAAADSPLQTACAIWIRAARQVEGDVAT